MFNSATPPVQDDPLNSRADRKIDHPAHGFQLHAAQLRLMAEPRLDLRERRAV